MADATGAPGVVGITHTGLCASDFERTLRFYTEGLGFVIADGYDIGDDMAQLAEVDPPMDCRAQMLTLGTTTIELLGWRTPAAEGSASTSRRQVGFTHLAVLVDDLPTVEARLVSLGGTAIEQTRTHAEVVGGAVDIIYVADPDGVRVELTQFSVS